MTGEQEPMKEEIEFEVAVNDVANVILANSVLRPPWLTSDPLLDASEWDVRLYQPNDSGICRVTLRRTVV